MDNDIKKNICSMSNQELFDIVHFNTQDYTIDAIAIAKEEIKIRDLNHKQIDEIINEAETSISVKKYIFRDTTILTKALIISIKIMVVFSIITLPFDYKEIGVIWGCLFIPILFLFFSWVYKSNSNVKALGAINMKYTPGWSVGWFFTPFLYKPYFIMEELWRSSQDPDNWGLFKSPSYILYWWLLWIGFFIFAGETRVFSLSLALTHTGIGIIITKIVGIIAFVLTFKIVNEIFNMQQSKYLTLTPPNNKTLID